MARNRDQDQGYLASVVPSIVEAHYNGTPGIFGISKRDLINHVVQRSCVLREVLNTAWESDSHAVLETNKVFEVGQHSAITLEASIDVVMESPQGFSFWEARATGNHKKAKPDRAQWGLSVARMVDSFEDVAYSFEVYFESGVLKMVSFDPDWVSRRDAALLGIVMGNQKPRPSASGCRVCGYRDSCTVRHVPKARSIKPRSSGVLSSSVQSGHTFRGIL